MYNEVALFLLLFCLLNLLNVVGLVVGLLAVLFCCYRELFVWGSLITDAFVMLPNFSKASRMVISVVCKMIKIIRTEGFNKNTLIGGL